MSLLRLKTQTPGVVALETAAMVPDAPERSRRRLIFAMFALTAMLLGVAVPTAIDLTDSRLKTPEEFEGILGFPPLGVALGSNGAGQESLRRIALGIMREWRTSGIRSYVLTSVRQGGNAYLALALADELRDLGVRALAIEASLTRSNGRHLKPSQSQAVVSVSTRETKRLGPRVANTVSLDSRTRSVPQTVSDGTVQRAQKNGVARTFATFARASRQGSGRSPT